MTNMDWFALVLHWCLAVVGFVVGAQVILMGHTLLGLLGIGASLGLGHLATLIYYHEEVA